MDLEWNEITDVAIIGSGFAGLAAAIEAHNAGASVIILYKMIYKNEVNIYVKPKA
jgi:thioredoxin reductase